MKSWPHFHNTELYNPKYCDEHLMHEGFMDRLEALRVDYGIAMVLSSAYRTPEHNDKVSSTGFDGPHTTGRAVDILVAGEDAYKLIALAVSRGFTGIGIKQKGAWDKRFIHLDDLPDGSHPRPRIWSY